MLAGVSVCLGHSSLISSIDAVQVLDLLTAAVQVAGEEIRYHVI